MMTIPQNNNLFLKGVFFDELESIEDKLLCREHTHYDNVNNDYTDLKKKITYDKIPNKFTNLKQWIEQTKNTKIKCWYCDSLFAGVPVFIPSYISNTSNGKIYETYGAFCGFGCAYGFLQNTHHFHDSNTYWDKLNMLKMLYFIFHNKKINDFHISPSKYTTELYGGDISIADFKKELKRINNLNIKN